MEDVVIARSGARRVDSLAFGFHLGKQLLQLAAVVHAHDYVGASLHKTSKSQRRLVTAAQNKQRTTNSPATNTCGMVGHAVNDLMPCRSSGSSSTFLLAYLTPADGTLRHGRVTTAAILWARTVAVQDAAHDVAEAALRHRRRALHEDQDVVGGHVLCECKDRVSAVCVGATRVPVCRRAFLMKSCTLCSAELALFTWTDGSAPSALCTRAAVTTHRLEVWVGVTVHLASGEATSWRGTACERKTNTVQERAGAHHPRRTRCCLLLPAAVTASSELPPAAA